MDRFLMKPTNHPPAPALISCSSAPRTTARFGTDMPAQLPSVNSNKNPAWALFWASRGWTSPFFFGRATGSGDEPIPLVLTVHTTGAGKGSMQACYHPRYLVRQGTRDCLASTFLCGRCSAWCRGCCRGAGDALLVRALRILDVMRCNQTKTLSISPLRRSSTIDICSSVASFIRFFRVPGAGGGSDPPAVVISSVE